MAIGLGRINILTHALSFNSMVGKKNRGNF